MSWKKVKLKNISKMRQDESYKVFPKFNPFIFLSNLSIWIFNCLQIPIILCDRDITPVHDDLSDFLKYILYCSICSKEMPFTEAPLLLPLRHPTPYPPSHIHLLPLSLSICCLFVVSGHCNGILSTSVAVIFIDHIIILHCNNHNDSPLSRPSVSLFQ